MASKVVDVEQAVGLVASGNTVTVSGILGVLYPEKVMAALAARFLSTGEPRDLTWFDPTPTGRGPGFEHFAHQGMLKRVIDSWYTPFPELVNMIQENQVEAYCLPLGTLHLLVREMARGSPGLLSQVGLNTYVDPRVQGGKLNSMTQEDLIKVIDYEGEDWLLYKTFPVDAAIIRGTTADEDGNLSVEEEPLTLGILYQAMAAKNSGGKVIAQVKRLAARGTIPPRKVEVPGILVDAIVLEPNQVQNETFPDRHTPGLAGEFRVPEPPIEIVPLDCDKVIARRAAMELRPGQVINCGGGIPILTFLPVAREEGVQELVTVTIEHGSLGGLFTALGSSANPTTMLTYQPLFDFYHGGGLDLTFLGIGQADQEGNINLDKFGPTVAGAGGSMDIAHATEKVVFCGTFTQGGLEAQAGDGKIAIVQEGRNKKFLKEVELITLNGRDMWRKGKDVLYITERAVFRLREQGPELVEIAPGIDLERDIIGQMEFRPIIADGLREMDSRIFHDEEMGLRRDLLGEDAPARPDLPRVRVENVGWERTIPRE
jgi:propionate CoA-transferase